MLLSAHLLPVHLKHVADSLVVNLVFSRAGKLYTYFVMICKSIRCILKLMYREHNSKKQKYYEISVILDI